MNTPPRSSPARTKIRLPRWASTTREFQKPREKLLSFIPCFQGLSPACFRARECCAYCGHGCRSRRPCRGHISVELFVQQLGGTACNLGSYIGALSFCTVLCAALRTLMLRTLFWTIWTNLNQRPLKRCCNNHASWADINTAQHNTLMPHKVAGYSSRWRSTFRTFHFFSWSDIKRNLAALSAYVANAAAVTAKPSQNAGMPQ